MTKKLLIAGGSHSDIPLIQAAKRLGFTVFTSGNLANAYGHSFGDGAYLADFSDPEAILELAKSLRVDAICPSANDFSMISSAYAAEQLGLPGYDSYVKTLQLHHKDSFRALCIELNLSAPRSISLGVADQETFRLQGLRYPLIVKPIDLTGGKGILRVDNPGQLNDAMIAAFAISRAGRIVVEEFFEQSSLHSHSCILRDGKIVFDFADNEYSYLNPYTVTTSTSPCSAANSVLTALRLETERLAARLDLVDGLLHCQFLVRGNDFKIVEYTRRMPGDLYSVPVLARTGVPYSELIVRTYLGLPITDECLVPHHTPTDVYFSRHCVLAAANGRFEGIRLEPEIESNIVDRVVLYNSGHRVSNYLSERLAIFFLRYDSQGEMEDKSRRINQLISAKLS